MRTYEQKYGFMVPPAPDPRWTWHLRWALPVGLLVALFLIMMPPWNPAVIMPGNAGACGPLSPDK